MNNSLKTRLLFWLFIFSALSVIVVIVLNTAYFRSREKLSNNISELEKLKMDFLKDFKKVELFFAVDANNNEFYTTRQSNYLEQHYKNCELLKSEITRIANLNSLISKDHQQEFNELNTAMVEYDVILSQLLDLILERGFKDDGVIGDMRKAAHLLETYPELDQKLVLSLRRHEKDYVIRNDPHYISELHKLVNKIKEEVSGLNNLRENRRAEIVSLLDSYLMHFNKMVLLNENIGTRNVSGYKQLLDSKEEKILISLNDILLEANLDRSAIFRRMEIIYIFYFVILFIISGVFSILISRRISASLSMLTSHIQQLIATDFKLKEKPVFHKAHYEVEVLYNEFHKMIRQLNLRDEQRDEAEKALRQNELKYRHLADMLPQSIFETNELGNFSYVNKTWLKTFGYSQKDINEGLNLLEVVKTDAMNFIAEGKEFNFREFTGIRKDNSTFPALVYTNSNRANNRVIGYTGVIIDNTERKKYTDALEREKRKAEESDRLKSSFLSNMSHEIRTPMNSIIGFTSLLSRKGNLDAEQEEYINYISQSGDMLLRLIDDIIDFAKIEAGELTIRKQECNLNKIIDELNIRFREIINAKNNAGIKLEAIKGRPGKNFNIITDPHRLNQILTNLLSNAVKFTDKGSVEFGYQLVEDSEIVFFIKDTGIGIAHNDQKIIFERFRQVDGSLNRNFGGTGLGLAITKHLVELLGGKINLESELNKGTSFFIEMPLVLGVNKKNEEEVFSMESKQTNWFGKTILISEDNTPGFTFLREALSSTGARVIRALNGKEAVELVEEDEEIDIVLMDMQMPVMDGYEATPIIKKIRPDLPVIAQTAYALSGEREKTIEIGCDDYISKPINIPLLIQKISILFVKNRQNAHV